MIVNVNLMVKNVIQIKSGIKVCVDVNVNIPTKHHVCKRDYVYNPSTWACEISRYSKSITDDLVITCDEIIEPSDTVSVNLNDKRSKM